MNATVLVIQNELDDPVALIGDWIAEVGVDVRVVRAFAGEQVPTSLPVDVAGVIAMGGSMGANDDEDFKWLTDERSLMKDAVAQDFPFFGVCLGGQMLATAVDGIVERTPFPEVGVATFRIADSAASDPVFGIHAGKDVIAAEWHQDYVTDLPDDAVVLAGNDVCPIQAFRIGQHVYGVQFHPEVDAQMFASWAAIADEVLDKVEHTSDQASAQVAAAEAELAATWRPVFQAWAKLVKAQQAKLS
jgi:GMP synthase-like glutamine amidotransferase